MIRKVRNRGDSSWHGYRLLVGAGLEGESVRLEERDYEVVVFYAWRPIRSLPMTDLVKGRLLEPGAAGPMTAGSRSTLPPPAGR